MRIAGVTTGRNRGDVIELTPEAKVPAAVGLAAATCDQLAAFAVTTDSIKVLTVTHQKEGDKLRKLWENSRYKATGTAQFWFRDRVKDIVHQPRAAEWAIEFIDCLDAWGMPELKIVSFTTT
jgi:hypothetical protein